MTQILTEWFPGRSAITFQAAWVYSNPAAAPMALDAPVPRSWEVSLLSGYKSNSSRFLKLWRIGYWDTIFISNSFKGVLSKSWILKVCKVLQRLPGSFRLYWRIFTIKKKYIYMIWIKICAFSIFWKFESLNTSQLFFVAIGSSWFFSLKHFLP